MEKSLRVQTIESYEEKFPNLPTLTLAKVIYKENNVLFHSIEDARAALRFQRGQIGEKQRATRSKQEGKPVDGRTFNFSPFKIPESAAEDWLPFKFPKRDAKILLIADVHLPYHDVKALDIALNYGILRNADTLLINGDLLDFYTLSRFEKDPRARHFSDELEMAREFLRECKKHFNHVYYKLGNHEERFEKYMRLKAPELLGVQDFELSTLLRQGEIGFELITDKRIIEVGHLNVLHGHEFFGGTSQAVNPARGLYLKTNSNCLIGHLHKSSSHTESTLDRKLITTTSVGCLCHLNPDYARINKWNHGFADIELSESGEYVLENKTIHNGKVY